MKAAVIRKQTAFRLRKDLLEKLQEEAKRCNRSLNNFVESILMESVYREPNQDTQNAMLDAKNNTKLENVDVSSFENFIKSIE